MNYKILSILFIVLLCSIGTAGAVQINVADGVPILAGGTWDTNKPAPLSAVVDSNISTGTTNIDTWFSKMTIDGTYVDVNLTKEYYIEDIRTAYTLAAGYQCVNYVNLQISTDNSTWTSINTSFYNYNNGQWFDYDYTFSVHKMVKFIRQSFYQDRLNCGNSGKVKLTEIQALKNGSTSRSETNYNASHGASNDTLGSRVYGSGVPGDRPPTYDGITVPHVIRLCRVTPTESWTDHVNVPDYYGCDQTEVVDLKGIPQDDMPSGGTSSRISPSEMFLIYWKLIDYPGNGTTKVSWQNRNTGEEFGVYNYNILPCGGNCEYTTWYYWFWEFLGHFSWEINKPGDYRATITTPWGNAYYDIKIIDTTATSSFTYNVNSIPQGATVSITNSRNISDVHTGTTPFSFTDDLRNGFTSTWSKTGYVTRNWETTVFGLTDLNLTLQPTSGGVWSIVAVKTDTQINIKACAGATQGLFNLLTPNMFFKFQSYVNPNECLYISFPFSDLRPYGTGIWYASIFESSTFSKGGMSKDHQFFEVLPSVSTIPDLTYVVKSINTSKGEFYKDENIVATYRIELDQVVQGADYKSSDYEYKLNLVDANGTETLYTHFPNVYDPSGYMTLANTVSFGNSTPSWNPGRYTINLIEIRKSDLRNTVLVIKNIIVSNQANPKTTTIPTTTAQSSAIVDLLSSNIFWGIIFTVGMMVMVAFSTSQRNKGG